MRLRVRTPDGETHKVEVPEMCDFAHLRSRVAQVIYSGSAPARLQFSLNKRDVINCAETALVASVGLRNGDLLYIMPPGSGSAAGAGSIPASRPAAVETASAVGPAHAALDTAEKKRERCAEAALRRLAGQSSTAAPAATVDPPRPAFPMDTRSSTEHGPVPDGGSAGMGGDGDDMAVEAVEFGGGDGEGEEPFVPISSGPSTLKKVVAQFLSSVTSPLPQDLLAIAIHAAMLESGLSAVDSGGDSTNTATTNSPTDTTGGSMNNNTQAVTAGSSSSSGATSAPWALVPHGLKKPGGRYTMRYKLPREQVIRVNAAPRDGSPAILGDGASSPGSGNEKARDQNGAAAPSTISLQCHTMGPYLVACGIVLDAITPVLSASTPSSFSASPSSTAAPPSSSAAPSPGLRPSPSFRRLLLRIDEHISADALASLACDMWRDAGAAPPPASDPSPPSSSSSGAYVGAIGGAPAVGSAGKGAGAGEAHDVNPHAAIDDFSGGRPSQGIGHPGVPAPHRVPLGSLFRDVRKLWISAKDALSLPLCVELCGRLGVPPPPSLPALPWELKLQVLRSLGPRELAAMSCASSELHFLAQDNALWEPLYLAEFGSSATGATAATGTPAANPAAGAGTMGAAGAGTAAGSSASTGTPGTGTSNRGGGGDARAASTTGDASQGVASAPLPEGEWKRRYVAALLARRRQRERGEALRRMWAPPVIRPPHPLLPRTPPFGFPGVIGGDYDRMPWMGGGILPGRGWGGGNMGGAMGGFGGLGGMGGGLGGPGGFPGSGRRRFDIV
eukprot:jgi/Mesvir1/8847/Mv02743-RA.1